LVDSTALGERLDPESLRRVLGHYFERMQDVLERHQGTVEKFIGDAVVGVFGVPLLHEDDALRAVRAAVQLQAALAELNKELERDWGVTLHIRGGGRWGGARGGAGRPSQRGRPPGAGGRPRRGAARADDLAAGAGRGPGRT